MPYKKAKILKDGKVLLGRHLIEVESSGGTQLKEISGSFYMDNPPQFTASEILEIVLDDGWHGNVRLSDVKHLPADGRYVIMFASPGKSY